MSKIQQEFDLKYENGSFIPDAQSYADSWEAASAEFRAAHTGEYDVAYGENSRARYDLIHPQEGAQGLFVFIHGGYWVQRHKDDWTCFGQGAFDAGWAIAHVGYPLAPEVRIADITTHIASAIAALAERVEGPIVLVGHSAGGHLAARMAMSGVLPHDVFARVRHVVPISPVSDLRPLLSLSLNKLLRLDEAEAFAESPALHSPLQVPVTVVVGAQERPVFLDQARWLSQAWELPHRILPGCNHLDVIDDLRDANSPLMKMILGRG